MPERAYKSSGSESVRMFKSDFIEFFSRVHPATPQVLYLPLIAASIYFAMAGAGLSILSVAKCFVLGLAIWTLLAIHHFPMKTGISNRLKQHHLRHHYHDDHAGYGVSSPLWDYVFRTNRR